MPAGGSRTSTHPRRAASQLGSLRWRSAPRSSASTSPQTFVISRESQDWADVVHVTHRPRRDRGRGEAAPIERYGETAAVRARVRRAARPARRRRSVRPRGDRRAPRGDPEASRRRKRALDAALHDLQGKLLGVDRSTGSSACRASARRRRGRCGSAIRTTWRAARRSAAPRFRRLKLKLGGGDGLDVERVRAVRRGDRSARSRSTSTSGGPLDEALDAVGELAELGVEYVEQPLREGDRGGAELKRRSPIPVYVDEDCHTLADVAACQEVAHGINIKLAKSGGIREAMRMVHAARALGLGVMLGCMIESGLGIAAGCAVAPLCDHVDLDGNLLLAHDPCAGPVVRRRRPGRLRGAGAWLRVSGR